MQMLKQNIIGNNFFVSGTLLSGALVSIHSVLTVIPCGTSLRKEHFIKGKYLFCVVLFLIRSLVSKARP